MRKVLSFVLVLALVLGSFSMAFATLPADVKGTPNEEAVSVLMGLGVVNGYEDGSFKPDGIVTRAEMAKLIVVALGLEKYAVGTSKFSDMTSAAWAQGYVNYANSLGVVKGYPDGTFKPSQTVSYDEACAMIVRALGYTDNSLLPATWPANYVVKAKALGLLVDVTSSLAGANRGDIAQMLYNALTVNTVSVTADNKVTSNADDNMLVRLGAKKSAPQVIYGNDATMINLVPYTGQYGVKYTKDDKVVAVDITSDNIVGDSITPSSIINASTSDDTDYTYSAAVGSLHVPFFWNGVEEPANQYHSYYSIDTVTSATGDFTFAVDLDGKKITTSHAISYWQVSTADEFAKNDALTITEDQTLFGHKFILDANDKIDENQFILEGAKSLSDIKPGNIVYVYNGYGDAGIKKIQVGTGTVTGKVTEKDGNNYTINGKVYNLAVDKIADKGHLADPGTLAVGDTITAKLDFNGYIYSFEKTTTAIDKYGVVTAYQPAGFNDAKVKLYTSADATTAYDINDDADVTSNTGIAISNVGTLIGYGLDNAGKIDNMNLEVVTASAATLSSISVLKTTDGTYPVASNAVVFTFNGTDYDLTTVAKLETGKELTPSGGFQMIVNDDGYVVAMIVNKTAATKTSDDSYAVVNDVVTALDADDNQVQRVTGLVNGATFNKYTDSINDITPNFAAVELYKFTMNADGVITATSKVTADVDGSSTIAAISTDKTAVKVGTTWHPIADGAKVYNAKLTDGEYVYTLSTTDALRDGNKIALYDTDSDKDGYDVIIFVK